MFAGGAQKKRLILVLGVLIFALGCTGVWYAYSTTTIWENDFLEERSKTIAHMLDYHALQHLTPSVEDVSNPHYLHLKDVLQKVKKVNPGVVVYIMVRTDSSIRFVADSEDPGSELYSPPGQVYSEAPEALHDLWRLNKPYVHQEFSDRWGTWSSGFASVYDENGRVVAVVGIDQNGVTRSLMQIVAVASVVIVTMLLLVLLLLLFFHALSEERTATLKSDFLAMASHELRSPLSAVRWKMAALMRDTTVLPSVRASLEDMEKHLAHVINLSSTFLQMTSLDHNVLVERMRKEVSLVQVVWGAVAKVSMQAEQKRITIAYAQASASLEGVTVFGVEEYMTLALINVLNNAIKYAPEGSEITLEGSVTHHEASIRVLDRGPGISQHDIGRMYQPFTRMKEAEASGKPGNGFGMYATHKVMTFHHGSIAHAPRAGGGTICTITFPVHTTTTVG